MDSHQLVFVFLTFTLFVGRTIAKCSENHFDCGDRKCVRLSLVCDGQEDCEDGSDEVLCIKYEQDQTLAAVEAAQYILSKMNAEYAWDDLGTPRALIALSFLERELLTIPPREKMLMIKRLDEELLMLLQKGVDNLPLPTLAVYINALYAVCQDPRVFHTIDLVELLRAKTDKAMTKDFAHAIVLLTFCIAKETRFEDFDQLINIYDDKRNDRIGLKALTVIAMAACHRQVTTPHHYQIKARVEDFVQRYKIKDSIGIYSQALIYQAYNAWQYNTSSLPKDLLPFQGEDGSFNDLLTTYVVIPALLNTSLADVQCKTRRFQYDETEGTGKKVNSVAGIASDVESGLTWTLYRKASDKTREMLKETGDIDYIYPEDEEHFILKLE